MAWWRGPVELDKGLTTWPMLEGSMGGSRREEVILGMLNRKGDGSGLLMDSDLKEDEDDEARGWSVEGSSIGGTANCREKSPGNQLLISISRLTCEIEVAYRMINLA